MTAAIKKRRLTVTLPLLVKTRESKSGKSTLVATTRGPRKAGIKIGGRDVMVVMTAYFKKGNPRPHAKTPPKDTGPSA